MAVTIADAVTPRGKGRSLPAHDPAAYQQVAGQRGLPLALLPATCPLCGDVEASPLGVSEDFTYRVSPDAWLPLRCSGCGSVFVSPAPASAMLPRLYPAEYYAQPAGPGRAGIAGRLHEWARWRALRRTMGSLDGTLGILDVGCGGGHHLRKLRQEGVLGVALEGVDPSPEAVEAGRASGLTVQHGRIEDLALPAGRYDLVLLIHTLEHLSEPQDALAAVRKALRPGGRAVVLVYNLASPCFAWFQGRHWGGYDFPRQRALYTEAALRGLADRAGLEWEAAATTTDSACWTESVHRLLSDWHAPDWLTRRFAPGALVAGALFAVVERILDTSARGGALIVTRPAASGTAV
jgi:SAM-dependent methyltransferase